MDIMVQMGMGLFSFFIVILNLIVIPKIKKKQSIRDFFKILNLIFCIIGIVFLVLYFLNTNVIKAFEYVWLALLVVYLNALRFAK